jgi:hypothetical protein
LKLEREWGQRGEKTHEKEKEKYIVKKEIKSYLEGAIGIYSNQAKYAETSCNRLLNVYYST